MGEGRYDMADLARATAKMAGFVEAHVAARKPARVIGLGYSNGANILASLIFARRDLFDDAVLMHPLIGWEPEPGAVRTRVLITAGERDPICPPALTRQLAAWFEAQGAPVETVWQPGGHGIDDSEIPRPARFSRTRGWRQAAKRAKSLREGEPMTIETSGGSAPRRRVSPGCSPG